LKVPKTVRFKTFLVSLTLVSVIFLASIAYVVSNGGFSAPNIYLDDLPSTASYTVKTDDTYFWAVRYDGKIPTGMSGTNDDLVIQYAINNCTSSGGSVLVKSGSYSASVTLKDNVTLILDKGARGITVTIDSGADGTLVDYQNGIRKEWVAGVLYTFMDLRTGELWWQGENRTDTLAFPEQTASYIVFQDGSLTKMKNGTTGQVDASSTNASLISKYVIGNTTKGVILYKAGNYALTGSPDGILISGKSNIRLVGEGNGTVFTTSTNINAITIHLSTSITIENLCINQTSEPLGTGSCIQIIDSDYTTLNELSLLNANRDAIYAQTGIDGLWMYRLHINNPRQHGISVYQDEATDIVLDHVTIKNAGMSGSVIFNATTVRVSFSSISDSGCDGYDFNSCTDVTLSNSFSGYNGRLATAGGSGVYIGTEVGGKDIHDVIIQGCIIFDNNPNGLASAGHGISVAPSGGGKAYRIKISDNIIMNNRLCAVHFEECSNSTVSNNILFGNNKHYAIYYEGTINVYDNSNFNTFKVNTIYGNGENTSNYAVYVSSTCNNNTITNNHLYDNKNTISDNGVNTDLGYMTTFWSLGMFQRDMQDFTNTAYAFLGDFRGFFDKSLFDNIVSIKFVAILGSDGTTYAKLCDVTNAVNITGSEISGADADVLTQSGDIKANLPNSLATLRIYVRTTSGSGYICNAGLIITVASNKID